MIMSIDTWIYVVTAVISIGFLIGVHANGYVIPIISQQLLPTPFCQQQQQFQFPQYQQQQPQQQQFFDNTKLVDSAISNQTHIQPPTSQQQQQQPTFENMLGRSLPPPLAGAVRNSTNWFSQAQQPTQQQQQPMFTFPTQTAKDVMTMDRSARDDIARAIGEKLEQRKKLPLVQEDTDDPLTALRNTAAAAAQQQRQQQQPTFSFPSF